MLCLYRWLAPEVVTQQHYSKAADVYSFGLILWELLTWQLPWADLGPFQVGLSLMCMHQTDRKAQEDGQFVFSLTLTVVTQLLTIRS